jgi:3-hydroxyacyl-[acyl-carrier-protein] dehydratase
MVDLQEGMNNMESILPHRYPFLMIDRVVALEPGRRAVTIKAVSFDDFFLASNVHQGPSLPEALIVEALAQTGGLAMLSAKEGGIGILVKVEEMTFIKTMRPGDQLTLYADVEFTFGEMAKVRVKAEAEGKIIAQGILVLAQGKR